jgi:hypothetical protein
VKAVHPITRRTDKLPQSHNMHAGLLLGVGILHQSDFGIRLQVRHLGELNEVVDASSVEFEVEACVLESARQLDDRLADILNLFLAGHLQGKKDPESDGDFP